MRINKYLFMALIASAAVVASAQTKFTSVYSSLGSGCKIMRGGPGQDDAQLCNGPGGYKVRVYSSAMATHIVAEPKSGDESYPLATVSLAFDDRKTKIEWRMANGKPFAAIFRAPLYAESENGPNKKIGEELVVVGLKGHDLIVEKIDAKTPNANAKAREAADAGYSKK